MTLDPGAVTTVPINVAWPSEAAIHNCPKARIEINDNLRFVLSIFHPRAVARQGSTVLHVEDVGGVTLDVAEHSLQNAK